MQMSKNNYVKVEEDWDQSFKTKIGEVMWRPFHSGINQVGDVQSPNLVGFQAKNNGFFYSVSYDETQGYELNLLQNKILSTFRFIDPSTTSELDTSSWKIHRNEKFGVEFKYPELADVLVHDFDNGGGYIKLPSGVDLVYREGSVPDLVGTKKETVIKIDGKDYPMFNQPYPGFSQSRILISPTKEIIINITNTDGENHDEIDLIYQILSTFKFFEPK
jgi:hypothetical protein